MDINTLLELDRQLLSSINGSSSLLLDSMMMTLTQGFTWIPLYITLIYIVIKNNETMAQILLTIGSVLLCILLADGLADGIVKPLVGRWRPSNDPIFKYTIDIVDGLRANKYGFFSAHAANTFSLAMFFSLLVRNKLFTVFMVGWSLLNCYTRMYLGLHYPIDICVGLIWGAIVGISVYLLYHHIYKRISPNENYISTQFTSTGYTLGSLDVVILIMTATILCSVFIAIMQY
jgi:undecaprenyl-diphosphatase